MPQESFSLKEEFPDLCKEWDYERNEKGPKEYTRGSGIKVWWVCLNPDRCCEHGWKTVINYRTNKKKSTGCPYCSKPRKVVCQCNNLLTMFPDLCKEWDERNKKSPEEYTSGSNTKVWWICSKPDKCCEHRWEAKISKRTGDNRGCPYCCNQKICEHNNLIKFSKICEEWDYDRNKKGPEEYSPGSHKKVWWKCLNPDRCCEHEWEATISNRTLNKRGCPYCCNQKLCPHNTLLAKNPDLCKEWDYKRNEKGPECYSSHTTKKAWWVCSNPDKCCEHIWEAVISSRTDISCKRGCPHCKQSKGEKAISKFLLSHSISYIPQARFDSCKHINCLPFDLFLPDFQLLIEYDGEQHFIHDAYYNTFHISAFNKRKKKDLIKTAFAATMGYSILRISFVEYEHVEEILREILINSHTQDHSPEFLYDVEKIFSSNKNRKTDAHILLITEIYKKQFEIYKSTQLNL